MRNVMIKCVKCPFYMVKKNHKKKQKKTLEPRTARIGDK